MPPEGASPGGEGCRGSPADGVVTSSLSLASSLRIAYPSKAPPVPSRSFHRSSSSRRKHFVGLRRELFLFGHRLTHSAAPPFPTANAALVCGGSPVLSPLTTPLKRPKEGPRPFLWKPSWSETGAGRLPPCGGREGAGGASLRALTGNIGTEDTALSGVPAVIQCSLLCGRRGRRWPGSSGAEHWVVAALRGTRNRTGVTDCRVGPLGLLAMTPLKLCHSGEARRADAPKV